MNTLNTAKVGKIYTINGFVGDIDSVARRFMELGIYKNQKVKVLAKSLLRKVTLIEICGYVLSVRTSLLVKVEVK